MKKLIPADTVDAAGNVWETVGENIREDAKEFSENDLKDIVNILFPVGSVYCGENSFILSIGTWEIITTAPGKFIQLGKLYPTGEIYSAPAYIEKEGATDKYVVLRMWRRVD